MATTEMRLNREWSTRPSDERFCSLPELHDMQMALRNRSGVALKHLSEMHFEMDLGNDQVLLCTSKSQAQPSHWAMSQLCSVIGAPASYIRELPLDIGIDCLNASLQATAKQLSSKDKHAVLVSRMQPTDPIRLRALNSDSYGRIWDHQVTGALMDAVGDGVSGDFVVPGEFGKRVPITKANTTIYGGDRSMFVFLADEQRRIEIPNRRDGKPGGLARGVMVSNSEVGGGTLRLDYMLFDYVCSNRIIWGAQHLSSLKIRHSSGAPQRFMYEAMPAIEQFTRSADLDVIGRIKAAQKAIPVNVGKWLIDRYGRAAASRYQAAHMADEGRPIESLWDVVTGMTAAARSITWQDERVKIETDAGKVLDLVTLD